MSARFARSALASLRASTRARVNSGLPARRYMSAESHGAHAKSSDTPWIIGAAVVFGPAFLYLLSPSARKARAEHAVHNDHHDYPALGKNAESHSQVSEPQQEEKSTELMKDDEGTPADVTATIALSEESDVPKDSKSPETVADTTVAAEQAPVGEEATKEETPAPAEESAKEETHETASSETPAAAPAKTEA
ncbi:hypothetical protein NP233_g2067 [Leucocoprinus birnbaumii]|uniref:Uncharacterized protein n=1 Tax=Leucocoprinus birnbaumii TaxID=56174 RepID=A0AAD5W1F5_9AGAR|nr:hypothetical protein NP233_g2067 [Leucocoprinus birnbaumii]